LLADHDLTEQQWRVLRALAAAESPIEVAPLADLTSLLAPSMTRILTNLEARDLVERRTVTHDQRRSAIGLTAAGTRLVRRIAPRSEALYNRIEAAFGADRLAQLLDELHDLAALDLTAVPAEEGAR
jgi:homoprotocatechuate degradation regulator HpaR